MIILSTLIRRVRPMSSLVNPTPDQGNLRIRERRTFSVRRHDANILVLAYQNLHQTTVGTFTSKDYRSSITSLESQLFTIQSQTSFLRLQAMTGITIFSEQRLNIPHEINGQLRWRGEDTRLSRWFPGLQQHGHIQYRQAQHRTSPVEL